MVTSIVNLFSSFSAISTIMFQQFKIYDWTWIIIFILVLIIVWALLSSAASNSEKEAAELTDRITQEQVPHSPDDLSRIEGIGPKIKSLLNDAGIVTFQQLADSHVSELQNILNAADLRIAKPSTWPQQARLAANEQWDDLSELQKNLKGGR